jgi:hypothetical protein
MPKLLLIFSSFSPPKEKHFFDNNPCCCKLHAATFLVNPLGVEKSVFDPILSASSPLVPTVPSAVSCSAFSGYLTEVSPVESKVEVVYGMDSVIPFHHLLTVTFLTSGSAPKIRCCPSKACR